MRCLVASFVALSCATVAAQAGLPLPAHITVATSVVTRAPEAGKPIALAVDVTPGPNIHVYAPGAESYEPIKVAIDKQPGVVVQQSHYPKSSILDDGVEKVPVYDKAFRLTQDVTVQPKSGEQRIVVKGRIDYQACDDAVCYKPASIPVTWTITLKP